MAFKWLNDFQQGMKKPSNYAEKTLAAYKLGMKAKGSIAGVRILTDPGGCQACSDLDQNQVYHPDEAPKLPLPDCDKPLDCRCVYRPVMRYEIED